MFRSQNFPSIDHIINILQNNVLYLVLIFVSIVILRLIKVHSAPVHNAVRGYMKIPLTVPEVSGKTQLRQHI